MCQLIPVDDPFVPSGRSWVILRCDTPPVRLSPPVRRWEDLPELPRLEEDHHAKISPDRQD